MSTRTMKQTIVAIALVAAAAAVFAAVTIMPAQLERYRRMQEAEQTAARISIKSTLTMSACGRIDLMALQRTCKQIVADNYPALKYIREAAASGNDVLWIHAVRVTGNIETSMDGLLKAIEEHEARHKKSPAGLRG